MQSLLGSEPRFLGLTVLIVVSPCVEMAPAQNRVLGLVGTDTVTKHPGPSPAALQRMGMLGSERAQMSCPTGWQLL